MKHEKFLHLKPEGGLSLTHGSLFSGIGGFDLAAEWMGWKNIFHCEWNPFGQQVLKHYWPNSISYADITKTDFTIHRGQIDILTGGFPCQPYSTAGLRKGKEDERHLWPEMLRAIRQIQPCWVVGENVHGIVNWNGGLVFNEVQVDLEAEGYEVQPVILPACAVNAPHRRDRVWFIGYSESKRRQKGLPKRKEQEQPTHRNSNQNPIRFGNFRPETSTAFFGSDNDGLPERLDGITFSKWRNESLKAYGNAIVPQVAFEIFRAVGVLNAKTLHETSL